MRDLSMQSVKRPKATLRDQVAQQIRRAIVEGELKPGGQVNQAQIAAQLEVSRAVVREALAQLEEEGLIDNIPYRGTFVKKITPLFVEELFGVRRVLEAFAVRLFIERAQEDDLAALRENVAKSQQLESSLTREESVNLDLSFHFIIFTGTHHSVLLDMWRSIETGLRLCVAQGHQAVSAAQGRIGMHSAILSAVENRDIEQACQLMEDHINQAEVNIVRRLSWD